MTDTKASSTRTALALLETARALLAKGWTQGWYAKDAKGREVDWDDPSATCWCTGGALYAAVGMKYARLDLVTAEQRKALDECSIALDVGYLPEWNDKRGRTQKQVLRVFDRAIEDASKTQKSIP